MQHKSDPNTSDEGPLNHSRRTFLKQTTALTAVAIAPTAIAKAADEKLDEKLEGFLSEQPLSLTVNGKLYSLNVAPRVTLLDLLREQLKLTGTKKGCDFGQCGACTIHVNGERVLSCLSLAVMHDGNKITTIEGLANGENLHSMQQAFITHDGFQCGYCTPGQIMSAVACIREGHANTTEEIKEYMSGNICRCGAYPNIVDAITAVKQQGGTI